MVSYNKEKKSTANTLAKKRRSQGLNATVFKKKKGYGVSVTRK